MVSRALSGLVCVFSVILVPAVWADFCSSHWDADGHHHESFQCGIMHCCGGCNKKDCCSEQENYLSQEDCPRGDNTEHISLPAVGGIVSVFPVVICVALVVCFVCPCCMLHEKCCKRRRRGQQIVINATNVPPQLGSPSGYQLFYPGYQSVPVQHGRGGQPVPTAPPPSYMEAMGPALFPGQFSPGQPMYPLQLPGQPYGLPLSELEHPPYNPSYAPNF
ncbi:protein shisa-5-like [Lates japonicus]